MTKPTSNKKNTAPDNTIVNSLADTLTELAKSSGTLSRRYKYFHRANRNAL